MGTAVDCNSDPYGKINKLCAWVLRYPVSDWCDLDDNSIEYCDVPYVDSDGSGYYLDTGTYGAIRPAMNINISSMVNQIDSLIIVEQENDGTTEQVDTSEYLLPNSDSQYLTESDLINLDSSEIRIARNEIYARRGMIFKSQDLQDYFNSKSWYNGIYTSSEFESYVTLNEFEKYNVNLIKALEN